MIRVMFKRGYVRMYWVVDASPMPRQHGDLSSRQPFATLISAQDISEEGPVDDPARLEHLEARWAHAACMEAIAV